MPCLDWERGGAFFDEWVNEQEADVAADASARLVVERLLEAAYDVAPADPARRLLAMSTAGAPVVYSHKCAARASAAAFRMLAEPGGTGVTVAEQISLSRRLLDDLLADLGWLGAAEPVDAVLERLISTDRGVLDEWHGGLGFGVEVTDDGPQLRVYCNVRHGQLTDRWQRLIDVVGEFADVRAESAVAEILQIAVPRAVPAGVAVAIGDGEVRGVRLYIGLLAATAESAVAAAPARFARDEPTIRRLVDSYCAAFGDLGTQGLTLAYDFAVIDGVVWPSVARYKVDLFCEPASGHGTTALLDWIDALARSLGLTPAGLRRFARCLDRHVPGWTFQYVSLGCRNGQHELSAYCVPGRAVSPDGNG